jgi:predicted nucleic acid-binding protein
MAVQSKKVYLSTTAFIAFLDRAHDKHQQAVAFFNYFGENQYFLYTDIITIFEVHKQIHYQISPALARDFLRTIFFSNINIIYPDEAEVKATLKTLTSSVSMDLTFERALVSTIANRRDISQICTFDYLPALFGINSFYLPI